MSPRNLCLFTVLAAVLALPATRKLEVEIDQSGAQTQTSTNVEIPPAVFLPVQSRNSADLAPGKLLVASREISDPNFAQTVILLVHYDAEGAVGLMLNRRTDLPISHALEQLKAAKALSDPVYLGGPVDTPTVFALLRSTNTMEGAEHVVSSVYWLTTKAALEKTISSHPDPDIFHVYLGYAGWTAAQLKTELRLGSWFIFQGDDQTVFDANPDSLWRQMIKKTELQMAACPETAGRRAPKTPLCPINSPS